MSRADQLPIDAFIASGVLFGISTVIILYDRFIKNWKNTRLNLPLHLLLILYVWVNEYWLLADSTYTLLLSLACLFGSTLREVLGILGGKKFFSKIENSYL